MSTTSKMEMSPRSRDIRTSPRRMIPAAASSAAAVKPLDSKVRPTPRPGSASATSMTMASSPPQSHVKPTPMRGVFYPYPLTAPSGGVESGPWATSQDVNALRVEIEKMNVLLRSMDHKMDALLTHCKCEVQVGTH